MKNLLFSAFALFTITALAQNQIRVEYEVQPTYDFSGSAENIDIFAKNAYYELLADRDESQYSYMQRVENEQPAEMNEGTIIVEIGSPGIHYTNTKEKFFLKETELNNRPYIIRDSLNLIEWKIEKETKEVQGIQTRKATASLKNNEITAWYAPKLNFKTGPDKYWGLPGLILEIETVQGLQNGGKLVTNYKAIKVEIPEKDKKIAKPKKGKEVTAEEFRELNRKANERAKEMYGGGVDKD